MPSKKKQKQLNQSIHKLDELYKSIPETTGCMDCIKKDGGCGGWCCQLQNPQVLYVEFLHIWRYVLRNWNGSKIADLIEASIRNYLSISPIKGCVLWDKDTKLCKIHTVRPFNCYIYGITPDEEFNPRLEKFRKAYENRIDVVVNIKDQCKEIKTTDGTVVTTRMTDAWWNKLVEIEQSVGIKKSNINDKQGGTYLTIHDHILLTVAPDVMMKQLQMLRMQGNSMEKEIAIKGIMEGFRKQMKTIESEDNSDPRGKDES